MEQKNVQRDALLEANNLSYKFDDVLNVSIERTPKKQFFDTRSYTMPGASQAVSTWNSGVDFINAKNSYLRFTVVFTDSTATNTGVATYGVGSAMNFIKEIKLLSASGVEYARTQEANMYHVTQLADKSPEWKLTVGAMMGCNTAIALNSTTAYTYCIPLVELDPYFRMYDGKLIPPNVASGMRVEITWENLNTVLFKSAGAAATSYTITDIEFRCDAVKMADSALAAVNKAAATQGIEITYDRVYTSSKNTGAALDDNIEIRKAVSLAKEVVAVCIPTAFLTSQISDSFAAAAYTYTSFDVRLGNQYYPAQPITNVTEGYFNFLKHYNKLSNASPTHTTLTTFTATQAQLCARFETDDTLALSSLPINSSRIAEVRFVRSANTDVKTFCFLRYTALCRASLTNVSVKI